MEAAATGPLRRCIVTRQVLPKEALLRFVIDPAGAVVPDGAGKLPGRGLWVKAERAALMVRVRDAGFAGRLGLGPADGAVPVSVEVAA